MALEENTTHPIRVLLLDDHELFRIGLRQLLEDEGLVVEDADSAQAALVRLRGFAPHVVVIGVNRPSDDGPDAIHRVLDAAPGTGVLVLSLTLDVGHVLCSLQAGAMGYVLKEVPLARILAGIRDVAAGHSALCPLAATALVEHLGRTVDTGGAAPPGPARELSPREQQVLALLASGCDNAEIGDRLFVSRSTVKHHVSRLLEKLEVDNRVQAAAYAVRSGLV